MQNGQQLEYSKAKYYYSIHFLPERFSVAKLSINMRVLS